MIDQSLDIFLSARGLWLLPDNEQPAQGFLNKVYFVTDDAGSLYVLRMAHTDNRTDIEDYIGRQLSFMGVGALGGSLSYRSVYAQVSLMKRLSGLGLVVPEVVASDHNWMLMRFVGGKSLKDIYETEPVRAANALSAVLYACMDVHAAGVCLWDRWGGNELIDNTNRVCFIDFDIAIDFPQDVSKSLQAALDLAFLLRGAIQYAIDPKMAADVIITEISNRKDFPGIYDLTALRKFLEGQQLFYEAEYCKNPSVDVTVQNKHHADNRYIQDVAVLISGLADRPQLKTPPPKRVDMR